jgi:hypothetical protein
VELEMGSGISDPHVCSSAASDDDEEDDDEWEKQAQHLPRNYELPTALKSMPHIPRRDFSTYPPPVSQRPTAHEAGFRQRTLNPKPFFLIILLTCSIIQN